MKTDKTNSTKTRRVNQYDISHLLVPDTAGDTLAVREIKTAVAIADWLETSGLIATTTEPNGYSYAVWLELTPRPDGVGSVDLATINHCSQGVSKSKSGITALRSIVLARLDADTAGIVQGTVFDTAVDVYIGRSYDRLARGAA